MLQTVLPLSLVLVAAELQGSPRSLLRLRAQHLRLAHHKVLTVCVTAQSVLPGWLGSAVWFNSSFRRNTHTLILLVLFRSPLWPKSLKGNENREIPPLYSTFCILLLTLLKFTVKEVTGKWVWVLFAFSPLFLNLSQSLSATGHSERNFSKAAVKTGTKGFQRKMEGKGSW